MEPIAFCLAQISDVSSIWRYFSTKNYTLKNIYQMQHEQSVVQMIVLGHFKLQVTCIILIVT